MKVENSNKNIIYDTNNQEEEFNKDQRSEISENNIDEIKVTEDEYQEESIVEEHNNKLNEDLDLTNFDKD
jgi:hypothetical protein